MKRKTKGYLLIGFGIFLICGFIDEIGEKDEKRPPAFSIVIVAACIYGGYRFIRSPSAKQEMEKYRGEADKLKAELEKHRATIGDKVDVSNVQQEQTSTRSAESVPSLGGSRLSDSATVSHLTSAPPQNQGETTKDSPPVRTHPVSHQELIDVNNADEPTISSLPGVGPILSKKAIQFRQSVRPFESIDDFAQVLGLKSHVLERLRSCAIVNPADSPPVIGKQGGRSIDL